MTSVTRASLVLAILVALLAGQAEAAPAKLTVTPQPFHASRLLMRVDTRATIATENGWRYFASWRTLVPKDQLTEGCASSSKFTGFRLARAGQGLGFYLTPDFTLGKRWCPGPSIAWVYAQHADPTHTIVDGPRRVVAQLRFTVLP